MDNMVFETFYKSLCEKAEAELRKNIYEKSECFSETIYEDFSEYLAGQLQSVCLRTLIAKMHSDKEAGKLKGVNPEAEYNFFCRAIVGKEDFEKELFCTFPVLKECVEKKIEYAIVYYTEIVNNFYSNREEIKKRLCSGANRISKISGGFSDVHNHGRQVLWIRLDNDYEILYKPHSMENEKIYSKLLKWLSEKTGISQLNYAFLSYPKHSWCRIVQDDACHSQDELKNYYRRLGVQIFLTYFLGTKDLHYENIIAAGEYPALIDLETLVHIRHAQKPKTAREEILYELSPSVLYSGLLPVYHWNKDGKGVDSSGISGNSGQKYPFKVAVVAKARTSEMHIEYRYPVSKKARNLATLESEFYPPYLYKSQILHGFTCAYRQVIASRGVFRDLLKDLYSTESRYLIADTQRYSMLLSGSYHPGLLMKSGEREKFLDLLRQGRKPSEEEIIQSEIDSLTDGDIPYFSYVLNETGLLTAQGNEVRDYFPRPAMDILNERLDKMCETDMERQSTFIGVSLDLMSGGEPRYINRVYSVKKTDSKNDINKTNLQKFIHKNVQKYKERLMDYAVWNERKTEVDWYTLELSSYGSGAWNIRPMNMYLYDGLAGILLILYALELYDRDAAVSHMRRALEQTFFQYTDTASVEPEKLQTRSTGAYNGESSIVYAYMVLYQLSGENIYLDYAKKHAHLLNRLIDEDKNYDMLSGNAGAAQVLLKMYTVLKDNQYLKMAVRAVDVLEKSAVRQEKGIGWPVEKNMPAMAGMAHGNSGILMPVTAFWKITGDEKYEKFAEQIWQYEEYLYDSRINNWTDVRSKEEKIDDIGTVAWCHGAGGILLSRLKCYDKLENELWRSRFEKDILRAAEKLNGYWKRDSWSLCHGICGNLMILEKATGKQLWPNGEIQLLPQEHINPGLMNGYGGILYYLLKQELPALPDVLGLE